MHRAVPSAAALALILSFATHASAQDDFAKQELKTAQDWFKQGRHDQARLHYQAFLQRAPLAKEAAQALLELSQCYGDMAPDDKAAALDCLRRLHASFPTSREAQLAIPRIENLTNIHFGWFGAVKLGDKNVRRSNGYFNGNDKGTCVFYRIPEEAFAKAVDAISLEDPPAEKPGRGRRPTRDTLDELALEIPRTEWRRVATIAGVPFHGTMEVPFERGLYAADETIGGFTKTHVFRCQSYGVFAKSLPGRTLLFAVSPWTGDPVAGVDLSVRTKLGTSSYKTGTDGLVLVENATNAIATARYAGDLQALELTVGPSASDSLVYIATDRPVYRPGQTVQWKAIYRESARGALSTRKGEKITFSVRDALEHVVQTGETTWDDDGTIAGSWTLGEEPPLGTYSVQVHVPNRRRWSNLAFDDESGKTFWKKDFEVAAYRKPEFRVTVEAGGPAISGSKIRATIKAEYYFGGPVANADVSWMLSRHYANRSGSAWPRAPFEDPLGWFREKAHKDWWESWFEHMGGSQDKEGTGRTDKDGTLTVEIDTVAARWPEKYTIDATVRDLSRFTAKGSGEVRAWPAALRVETGTSRMFVKQGETFEACARVTTLDGKPAASARVELEAFVAIDAADRELEFESFHKTSAPADEQGLVKLPITATKEGRVRLRARVQDDSGRTAEDRADSWVAGTQRTWPADDYFTSGIAVLPDKLVYEDGETARIMVQSEKTPTKALLVVEGDTIEEARVIALEHPCEVVELPVKPSWTPNVHVKLHAWTEGTPLCGGYEIHVFPRKRMLDVLVASDRPSYGPHQKAKVTLTTRCDGKPVAADVCLGVVDESIYAIEKDSSPDLRKFFCDERTITPELAGTVPPNDIVTIFSRRRGGSGGAMSGAALTFSDGKAPVAFPAAEAADVLVPADVRRFFPDTLFWNAHVKTGADGKAELELETPDSLTEWRFTARALSGVDRFGSGTGSMVTRKDVIVRLAAPRFFNERDEGTVATVVHNDRPEDLDATVRLTVTGATADATEKKVTVPSHSVARVDWKLKGLKPGTLRLKAEALTRSESDAMELAIPVQAHGAELQARATGAVLEKWQGSLVLPEDAVQESAELEVFVSSAGLQAVSDALPFLADYPYGCVEQTMSRFLPSVTASRAMKRLGIANATLEQALPSMVKAGLARLYGFQHEDGGWGWWVEDETNPGMTAYVVYGLATAKKAGFAIDEERLERGRARLRDMDQTPFALYALSVAGDDVKQAVSDFQADENTSQENLALLVLAGRHELAQQLSGTPPQECNSDDVRTVALVIRALASESRSDPRIGTLLSWLMEKRRGAEWLSTLDTAHVVFALTEIARAEPELAVRISVNGTDKAAKGGRVKIPAAGLKAGPNAIQVVRSGEGTAWASAILRYHTKTEQIMPEPGALVVSRRIERSRPSGNDEKVWEALETGSEVGVSDELRMVVTVRPTQSVERVMIETPLAAVTEGCQAEDERSWWQRREERDDRVLIAAYYLGDGDNEFSFRIRPTQPGVYHVMPARAFAMYDPDRCGSSGEFLLRVVDR